MYVTLTEEKGEKILVNLARVEYIVGKNYSELHFGSHYITVQESKQSILDLTRSVKTDQNNEGEKNGN